MKGATAALLLLSPVPAFAADGSPAFSLAGTLVQTIGALALVIGIIVVVSRLSEKWLRGGGSRLPRYIRVIENRCIAPKKNIMLVEVGGEYILLGSSGDGLTFLKQVDMLEEIEVVEERRLAEAVPSAVLAGVKGWFGRLPAGAGRGNLLAGNGVRP